VRDVSHLQAVRNTMLSERPFGRRETGDCVMADDGGQIRRSRHASLISSNLPCGVLADDRGRSRPGFKFCAYVPLSSQVVCKRATLSG
jgi:hypothetical protein